MPGGAETSGWPASLRPGGIRFGRASGHYDETVAFYRDLVGLPVIGEFRASFDEDGTIFGLPDTAVQLEVTRAHESPVGTTFDQLTLYLEDQAALERATAALRAAGRTAAVSHPYWAANRAVTYRDPDDREVVFAPWVYGQDPEPIEGRTAEPGADPSVPATRHEGERADGR